MECLTKRTIKIEQIQKVIDALSVATLDLYFKNWRFAPFKRRVRNDYRGWCYEYVYCKDFFNNLYTYLIFKKKDKAAKNLKDTFALVGMQLEFLEE